MQSSPNRERVVVSGCHCPLCSPFRIAFVAGRVEKKANRKRGRYTAGGRRKRDKPKGQHEYRKGRVR